jgi:hypothetical protein
MFCRPGERPRTPANVYGIVGPLTIELAHKWPGFMGIFLFRQSRLPRKLPRKETGIDARPKREPSIDARPCTSSMSLVFPQSCHRATVLAVHPVANWNNATAARPSSSRASSLYESCQRIRAASANVAALAAKMTYCTNLLLSFSIYGGALNPRHADFQSESENDASVSAHGNLSSRTAEYWPALGLDNPLIYRVPGSSIFHSPAPLVGHLRDIKNHSNNPLEIANDSRRIDHSRSFVPSPPAMRK